MIRLIHSSCLVINGAHPIVIAVFEQSFATSCGYRGRILEMATHVVLVHPQIHWNTGNAGRSCLAAGAKLHLIKPLGFSLTERQLKRAGLDYWEYVDPDVWPSWEAFENELPALGVPWF